MRIHETGGRIEVSAIAKRRKGKIVQTVMSNFSISPT
jgi:hypothetical protein